MEVELKIKTEAIIRQNCFEPKEELNSKPVNHEQIYYNYKGETNFMKI